MKTYTNALLGGVLAMITASAAKADDTGKISAQIKAPEEKKATSKQTGKYRLSLSGLQYVTDAESASVTGFSVDADTEYKVSDGLKLRAWGFLSAKSGYTYTRSGALDPKRTVGLIDAYVEAKPAEVATLQVGIINQGIWNAPSVIDGLVSFPGATEAISIGEDYKIELKAGQFLPTSSTTNASATQAEQTPGFTIETLTLAAEPKDALLHASLTGGHWQYHNLPATIVEGSDTGNTLITVNGKRQFRYGMEGYLGSGSLTLNITKDSSIETHLQVFRNTQAPEGLNLGQVAGASAKILLPKNIVLEPGLEFAFSEADMGPAAFNGGTNSEGYTGTLFTTFKDLGFKLKAYYTDSAPINANPLMVRNQTYLLKFETLYANF